MDAPRRPRCMASFQLPLSGSHNFREAARKFVKDFVAFNSLSRDHEILRRATLRLLALASPQRTRLSTPSLGITYRIELKFLHGVKKFSTPSLGITGGKESLAAVVAIKFSTPSLGITGSARAPTTTSPMLFSTPSLGIT